MKYRDLVQFEPVETVIELRSADKFEEAQKLVETYVISDAMADKLTEGVFKHLQFEKPYDTKGIFIVGNYGTGKSHLMSVISAIAEHKELAELIQNQRVKEGCQPIAGKFKVIRTEIGATTMPLRDIIVLELQRNLKNMGVEYNFPSMDKVPSNKPAFEQMMEAFHQKYPDHGLLLVVDELLDYLRHRNDLEISLDLAFLREMGEVTKDLRFRFIAGVQEALFNNPRFFSVADSVRRVAERYVEVTITREDIKFVVAHRLLRKNQEQKAKISEHLSKFAPFYGDMNERMDQFVSLFPVHPDYIDTFERLTAIETRQVLKTLSSAMREILDEEVPEDAPGLISYDQYWKVIKENPSLRLDQDIRAVYECSTKLEDLVETGYPKNKNLDFAKRIIYGLSIHRLTVGDIRMKVGLTPENLRDQLCLWDPLVAELGGDPAEDLKGEVETTLRLISEAVNGQFISATDMDERGRLSGQFYLDIDKTVDYDALIRQRAESMSPNDLDLAYFDVLAELLERTDQYYPGTRLAWEYELEWKDHGVYRLGYIFFGAPNERSTAQPPRDFYLFFLRPFEEVSFKDEKDPRDVFFKLVRRDESFEQWLKLYAAAKNLAQSSSGVEKSVYAGKMKQYKDRIGSWLTDEMLSAYDVTYQGKTKLLGDLIADAPSVLSESRNFKNTINWVAEKCLAPHFADLAPEYPVFKSTITRQNQKEAISDALNNIRAIARDGSYTSQKTQRGWAILESLELVSDGTLRPESSRYAKYILNLLERKKRNEVLNRSEILERVEGGVEYMAPGLYRVEPEWVSVILAALTFSGDLVVTVGGREYDASKIEELISLPLDDLCKFSYVKKPKDWPLPEIRALFELVGLAPGLSNQITLGSEEPVRKFQEQVESLIKRTIDARNNVNEGFYLFNESILSDEEVSDYKKNLDSLKEFLDSLTRLNTTGKFKNVGYPLEDIEAQKKRIKVLNEIEQLHGAVSSLKDVANYLSQAENVLPQDNKWVERFQDTKKQVIDTLKDPKKRNTPSTIQQITDQLKNLKAEYIEEYLRLHSGSRLDKKQDEKKAKIIKDERLKNLEAIAPILSANSQIVELREQISTLKPCYGLTKDYLENSPICPMCSYKPAAETLKAPAGLILDNLQDKLDEMLESWTQKLVGMLEDPIVQNNIKNLLYDDHRKTLEDFLSQRKLPSKVTSEFVAACNQALGSLVRVTINKDELMGSLIGQGGPVTIDELSERLEKYLSELIRDKDPAKVRIVFE